MTATLQRISDTGKETLGVFSFIKSDGQLWIGKSLELPWKQNLPEVSCIPQGTYSVVYTRSNRLSRLTGKDYFTYEVLNVPQRTGIRLHSANYFAQLHGCIAIGNAYKDLNADGQMDIIHSGITVKWMCDLMNYQPFTLEIRNAA